jgi:hypothetical protein
LPGFLRPPRARRLERAWRRESYRILARAPGERARRPPAAPFRFGWTGGVSGCRSALLHGLARRFASPVLRAHLEACTGVALPAGAGPRDRLALSAWLH